MNTYNSEHKQDLWLHENVFRGKTGGTFVEFGAIDGLMHSNSLFFEKHCGWNGVCIEPNPTAFEQLKQNRQCQCFNYAVGNREAFVKFEKYEGGLLGWSGVSEFIEDEHKKRVKKFIPEHLRETIQVQMRPLNAILEEAGIWQVDYMSIDTEGSEFAILEAFDFTKFDVKLFDIENNFKTHPIEELMNDNGYQELISLDINDIYVKG